MSMLLDNELGLHAHVARSLVDTYTSTQIWRTGTKIHELIRSGVPTWQKNFFLRDEKEFAILLGAMSSGEELISVDFPRLPFERFEEGHHEPTMFSDTQFPGEVMHINGRVQHVVPPYITNDVRAYIIQREIYRLSREGCTFEEAYRLVRELDPSIRDTYVDEFKKWGMEVGNIFYRKVSDFGKGSDTILHPNALVTT